MIENVIVGGFIVCSLLQWKIKENNVVLNNRLKVPICRKLRRLSMLLKNICVEDGYLGCKGEAEKQNLC